MFRVYFINFDYHSQHEGNTLDEAKTIARSAGFDARIEKSGEIVGFWSILNGYSEYK
jgi:7-cyano-7-deazaguanine synthase in queuosine biosynthesis